MANSAEASARTVEAAVAAAAATLGLRPDQVEVEVLEEAVPTTFGKIGHPARVRVVRRPADQETVPAGISPSSTEQGGAVFSPSSTPVPAVSGVKHPGRAPEPRGHSEPRSQENDSATIAGDTELAGDFIEGFLDVADLDGDITTWVDQAGGHVDVEGGPDLNVLVGSDGETLSALQELTRLAVLRQTKRRPRITLDVERYRARRREELVKLVHRVVEQVVASGEAHELRPMTSYERKVVHDVVADAGDVRSESIGEEPYRRVVIRPA